MVTEHGHGTIWNYMELYGTIWDYGTLRPLPYLLDEKGEYRNPYDAG